MEVKGVVVVEDACVRDARAVRSASRRAQEVANRPIADHVLDALHGAGVEEVVVASSVELGGAVRECLTAAGQKTGTRLQFVEQRAPIDFGSALELAAPLIGSAPCITHLANGLLAEPIQRLIGHLRSDSPDVVFAVHQGPAPDEHLSPATQDMLHIAELDPERGRRSAWLAYACSVRTPSATPAGHPGAQARHSI